jgi:hypothetical protein
MIDLRPALDWFGWLACFATWGGLAALLVWLVVFHPGS